MRKSILHSVRLDDDVWEAVKAMGVSLNSYLRHNLISLPVTKAELDRAVKILTPFPTPPEPTRQAFRPPLLKPSEKRK